METFTTGPKRRKVELVDHIEVPDMIRVIAKLDPLRNIPEAKRLLDMSLEEYEQETAGEE